MSLLYFAPQILSDFFLLRVLTTDTAFLHWYSLWVLGHFPIYQKNLPNQPSLWKYQALLQIWFQFWLRDAFLNSYMAFILALSKLWIASKKYLGLAKSKNTTYLDKHQSLFLKGKETWLIQIKWKWTITWTRFRNMLFSLGSYLLHSRVRNDNFYCHFSLILPR